VNTDAPSPDADANEAWVLEIQAKLHQWASDGPEHRFGPNDATAHRLNQRLELVESRMRGNAHVRFGGRAGETGRAKARYRASVRPYCGERYLGERRCPDCGIWCRRVGLGGNCPECDQALLVAELLAEAER